MVGRDVFISHAYKDGAAAEALRADLEGRDGLSCWTGRRDIAAGESWPAAITRAVASSGVMVVLLSQSSVKSPHVEKEVGLAAQFDVPVLPVRIEDVELEGDLVYWLAGVNWINAFEGTAKHSLKIAQRVRELIASKALPTRPAELEVQTIGADLVASAPERGREDAPNLPRVSRAFPACIIVLVDCSNSMNQRLGRTSFSRRVVVAQQINSLLDALVQQASTDLGTLPYFWIAVQGYGVGNGREVRSLLPETAGTDDLVPIDKLSESVRRWDAVEETVRRPDGSTTVETVEHPIWVEPIANVHGHTVGRAAFQRALELSDRWVSERPMAFPPLVLNITDGGYTDGDPSELVRAIEELATEIGNALVFNCHLSSSVDRPTIEFPTEDEAVSFRSETRLLFDQSSPLPPSMLKLAEKQGRTLGDGARGYVFNGEATNLVDFFEIGTIGRLRRQ